MDAGRLIRTLLSLPHPELRREWLEDQLSRWPSDVGAQVLNALVEQSESADPSAREAHLTIALLFVGRDDAPLTKAMRREAALQRLFSLERVVRRTPRSSPPPAKADERVPDYGLGRELTLGERRSLARKPDRRDFERLLFDPHPLVIRQLLQNPKMTEDDAVRLAARRPAQSAVLRELSQSPRWVSRTRVRMALLLNPGAPGEVSLPLLGLCTRPQLREVLASADTPLVLRATARELLDRRPPMPRDANPRIIQ